MSQRPIQLLCHDCQAVLTDDEHAHYVYQCHDCVAIEHDLLLLAERDPDHPDLERLLRSAVEIGSRRPSPVRVRTVAGVPVPRPAQRSVSPVHLAFSQVARR